MSNVPKNTSLLSLPTEEKSARMTKGNTRYLPTLDIYAFLQDMWINNRVFGALSKRPPFVPSITSKDKCAER